MTPYSFAMKNTNSNSLVIDTGTHPNQNHNVSHNLSSAQAIMANLPAVTHHRHQRTTTTTKIMNFKAPETSNNGHHYIREEVNGNLTYGFKGPRADDRFEIPLPFGYHMDLDFLRFCSGELVNGETLNRLKELRRQRRKQRKTLEVLMGIRQEQKEREMRKQPQQLGQNRSSSTPRVSAPSAVGQPLQQPDLVKTPEFVAEALRDAVCDFERHLERSRVEEERSALGLSGLDLLHSSTPKDSSSSTKCARFNTFPRALSSPDEGGGNASSSTNISTFKLFRQPSNSSISSASTSPDAVLANLPSSVRAENNTETESITSITSDMSTGALRNIREQMARSLQKLREYEKQVEAIPVMQARLSVLKEEKRLLMLQLKQREMQLRRDRNEETTTFEESDAFYDTEDDEDLDEKVDRMSKNVRMNRFQEIQASSRARSESPYARGGTINPDEFISVRKKRSASCGYNSDSDLVVSPLVSGRSRYFEHDNFGGGKFRMAKSAAHYNLSTPHIERSVMNIFTTPTVAKAPKPAVLPKPKKDLKETGVNTDPIVEKPREKSPPPPPPPPPPLVRKRDRSMNTDPPPRSPPPPRKFSKATNTLEPRNYSRGVGTSLSMDALFTRDELESRVQEAVFKTEEEIMGCPLLQRAMAVVEEEAMHGGPKTRKYVDTSEQSCQVGDDNLKPFVISVGLQCKLDDVQPIVLDQREESPEGFRARSIDPYAEKLVRSIGVGDCKLIEDPAEPQKFREIGVCTEKWVEVIKASKQTDTDDFAFKDTESPRVADLFFEPSPERVVLERRSSLRRQGAESPSFSRKSSSAFSPGPSRKSSAAPACKPIMRTQGTMTHTEVKLKVPTRDAKIGGPTISTRSVGINSPTQLSLPLKTVASPLSTPEKEKKVNLCDKCDADIHKVAQGMVSAKVIAPPSPDMPWLSKIPRPVPENPDVHKLKSASSIGNLSIENRSSPHQHLSLQGRSKSNLTPTTGRRFSPSPKSPLPQSGMRDVGTPPPHPATPPAVGSKRAPSPLARSQSPYTKDKRSLIPKLSPGPIRRNAQSPISQPQQQQQQQSSPVSSGLPSPITDSKSLIPRIVTPPALRKMYPKTADKLATPDRNVVRKNTFTKLTVGVSNPDLDKAKPVSDATATSASTTSSHLPSVAEESKKKSEEVSVKKSSSDTDSVSSDEDGAKPKRGLSSAGFPLPGAALFAPIDENRKKAEPSKEMRAALKVLNDSISRVGTTNVRGNNAQVTNAVNIIQQEWFKASSTKQSNPLDVEDYLDAIEDMSSELLARVVNLTDVNGNTALHYSVSHGNFDVVSVLLDSKVANPNVMNKAGYTCIMLISLAHIAGPTHRAIVSRLFSLGDVNARATQHGQTALMLAVSHGRLDMAQLLVEAGAEVNIRDEDGSTALMCAAEHGHMEIVKFLMQQPETNVLAKDNDGLTALAVAMEAGHRDVGVVLYANMSFSRGTSPYSSMRLKKSSGTSPSRTPISAAAGGTKSPSVVGPTPPLRTRRNSSNQ